MRVLVLGANGFIGSHVAAHLARQGHQVIAGLRHAASPAPASFDRLIFDFASPPSVDTLAGRLAGIDTVVNCVGALQDGQGDSLKAVHVDGPKVLFEACEMAGIARLLHISAIGADATGTTGFATTKADTEHLLKDYSFDWVVLRPGLVVGHAAFGGTAALRGIAGIPWLTPIIASRAPIRIVSMSDLVAIVEHCLIDADLAGRTFDVVSERAYSLAEITAGLRSWLGFGKSRILEVPAILAIPALKLGDLAGWLGWRNPLRTTAITQLAGGIDGNPDHAAGMLGRPLETFEWFLDGHPANTQDRWHARLFFFKAVAIVLLAAFWIATGLITLGPGREQALGLMSAHGMPAYLVSAGIYGGGLIDLAIGLAMLWRPSFRGALAISLIVSAGYLIVGSVLAPDIWFDPLGAFVKIVPVMGLTVFLMAVGERR